LCRYGTGVAVESREQIHAIAENVGESRRKKFCAREVQASTSPYASFPGKGEPGLKLMREAADIIRTVHRQRKVIGPVEVGTEK